MFFFVGSLYSCIFLLVCHNYASNCADFLKALNFSCVSPNDNTIVEWHKFRVVNCYAITMPKMLRDTFGQLHGHEC